jgi:hypothetical protein
MQVHYICLTFDLCEAHKTKGFLNHLEINRLKVKSLKINTNNTQGKVIYLQ